MLHFHTLREAAFVAAGAMIAPRARLATAILLATARVPFCVWAHVLAMGGPWWSWSWTIMINDRDRSHWSLASEQAAITPWFVGLGRPQPRVRRVRTDIEPTSKFRRRPAF